MITKRLRILLQRGAVLLQMVAITLLFSCNSNSRGNAVKEAQDKITEDFRASLISRNKDLDYSLLRNGDLIFQTDTTNFSEAINGSTNGNFSHVGIIQRIADTLYLIDATPKRGVSRRPLESFMATTPKDSLGRPMVRIMRIDKLHDLPADSLQIVINTAVQNAIALIGKSYDYAFDKGQEKIYCSELVYESYLYKGSPIFPTVAMNFTDSTGNIAPFWIEHYRKMGREVPQGEEGTNPNDLSKSSILKEIAF